MQKSPGLFVKFREELYGKNNNNVASGIKDWIRGSVKASKAATPSIQQLQGKIVNQIDMRKSDERDQLFDEQ